MKTVPFLLLVVLCMPIAIFGQRASLSDSLRIISEDPTQVDTIRLEALDQLLDATNDLEEAKAIVAQQQAIMDGIDSEKWQMRVLMNLIKVYRIAKDFTKAVEYAEAGIAWGRKIGKESREVLFWEQLARCRFEEGDHQKMIAYLLASEARLQTIADSCSTGVIRFSNINLYKEIGSSKEVIKQFTHTLAILKHCGERRLEALALLNIGGMYEDNHNWADALEYYERGVNLLMTDTTKSGQAQDYLNIIKVYGRMAVISLQQSQLEAARLYLDKINQFHPYGESTYGRYIQALVAGKIARQSGDYEKSLQLLQKAEEQLSHNMRISDTELRIEQAYLAKDMGEAALAHSLADQVYRSSNELSDRVKMLALRYEVARMQKNKDEALIFLERLQLAKDSLKEDELTKSLSALKLDLEYKYQLMQREQEQAALLSELARQRTYLLTSLGGLVLVGGLLCVIMYAYRRGKKLTRQLAASNQQLYNVNQRLDRFASIISHDILSHLNLMLSTGNVLVGQQPKNTDKLIQYYEATQTINYRLRDYCEALLREASNTDQFLPVSQHEANQLVMDVLKQFEQPLRQKGFKVTTEKLPALNLPKAVIYQLLQNVITNAVKYAPQEGRLPQLRFSGGTDEADLSYWLIQDNGPGLQDTGVAARHEMGGKSIGLQKLQESLTTYGYSLQFANQIEGGLSIRVCRIA